jgi:spore coat protein U-like protein
MPVTPRRHASPARHGLLPAIALLWELAAATARAAGGASCSLAATPLAFGPYVPFSSAPTDFTATITVTCTAIGVAAVPLQGTIALTGTAGQAGGQLSNGASVLRYHTYLDPARTMVWGNGNGLGGTATVTGVVGPTTPFRHAYTVYGRILARQTAARVGTYADQLTAVLTY